ncbi:MAG: energy-coupling factor transporter ATPase [Selenomonadaceae bacterium]|nr:energy-coupling factor transporter ATPase [Selenomonadaceae bacterium]
MAIEVRNVDFFYDDNIITPHQAIYDLSLTIDEGDMIAVAGETGSGKSTLAEIMAGLAKPKNGEVFVDGANIYASKDKKERLSAKEARRKVGMAFQYAEYQLFEETVEKDIAFAPKEMGFSKEQTEEKVNRAMELVGLDTSIKDRAPYNLSGGEKRRVAIAGILAFSPKYLILDEPMVGLDGKGQQDILNLMVKLNREDNTTIIFISHSMENIAEIARKMIVMKNGRLLAFDKVYNIFSNEELLRNAGLKRPPIWGFLDKLKTSGINVKCDAITEDEGVERILFAING